MSEPQTDEGLLFAQGPGAEAAFTELIRRHQDFVFRVAFSQTGDVHAAEEVAQETFLRLAGGTARPNPGRTEPFRAWLYVMVANLARGWHRRERRLKERHANFGALAGDGRLTEETSGAERQELRAALAAALGGLSRELRELIVLHYLEGFSQMEMSRMTGVSQSSISRRLEEGLGLLRKHLAGAGLAVSVAALPEYLKDPALLQAPAAMGKTLAGTCARVAQAGGDMARGSLRTAAYRPWGWSAGMAVCGLAAVVGVLWFVNRAHRTAAPVMPPVSQQKTHTGAEPLYAKRWDFNTPEQMRELFRTPDGLELAANGGQDGSGCLKTNRAVLVLHIQGVPVDRLPLRVRIKHRALPGQLNQTLHISCNWDDSAFKVYAPIRNVGAMMTFREDSIPWCITDCYLSEDFMDEWLEGRRSTLAFNELTSNRSLLLAIQGQYLVDEIEIAQLAPEEVPDLSPFRKAVATIPAEQYIGKHMLSAFPSPREGKQVYVEFLKSPRLNRDAQAVP